mmetsp:Transcript_3946/g.10646  ORF Transcript_3946/g.10646 Transcript_3946/m.10646 type:complete len:299 (+) Transcript_3946:454-1350(+)
MPNPSEVDVPRPSSSTMTRERSVAVFRMHEASSISAMKVEIPRSCMSEAPTRHMIESKTGSVALLHGTKQPTWFRSAIRATERMYVLFPPMLGPVMRCRRESSLSMSRSFAMKALSELATTSKWLAPSSLNVVPEASTLARTMVQGAVSTTRANAARTSRVPMTSFSRSTTETYVEATESALAASCEDCASYLSSASLKLLFSLSSSGVVKMNSCFLMARTFSVTLPLNCCTAAWCFFVTRSPWPSGHSQMETVFSPARAPSPRAPSTTTRTSSICARTLSRATASSPSDLSKAELMQ